MYLRHLQENDSTTAGESLAIYAFALLLLMIICSLARNYRLQQRESRIRREAEVQRLQQERTKQAERRREQLLDAFKKNELSRVLLSSDIHGKDELSEDGLDGNDVEKLRVDEIEAVVPLNEKELEPNDPPRVEMEDGTEEEGMSEEGDGDVVLKEEKEEGGAGLTVVQNTTEAVSQRPADKLPKQGIEAVEKPCAEELVKSEESGKSKALFNKTEDAETEQTIDLSSKKVDGESEDADLVETDEGQAGYLRRRQREVVIPASCAICLERYQEGETVVWSGNPKCQHVFHHDCILEYLIYQNSEATPCPCCRQFFLPMT